jgi:hypothetical protein
MKNEELKMGFVVSQRLHTSWQGLARHSEQASLFNLLHL